MSFGGPESILGGIGSVTSQMYQGGMDMMQLAMRGLATGLYANEITQHDRQLRDMQWMTSTQQRAVMNNARQAREGMWGRRYGTGDGMGGIARSGDWAFGTGQNVRLEDSDAGPLTRMAQQARNQARDELHQSVDRTWSAVTGKMAESENILNDTAAQLSGFSQQNKQTQDQMSMELDAMVSNGQMSPAAAAAQKQVNRLQGSAQVIDTVRKYAGDLNKTRAAIKSQNAAALGQIGSSLESVRQQGEQWFTGNLMQSFQVDRETEHKLLDVQLSMIDQYKTEELMYEQWAMASTASVIQMVDGMQRQAAAMLAGIALSPEERGFDPGEPFQVYAQHIANRRAQTEANNAASGTGMFG